MDLRELREMIGLTIAQAADELNIPRQDVADGEENEDTYLLSRYISVFPVNPEILANPQAEPFLDTFDRTTPGERMKRWREENGITLKEMAHAIGETEEWLSGYESGKDTISRSRGEIIEKKTGINRKWLMFGDGRNKGEPKIGTQRETGKTASQRNAGNSNPKINKAAGQRIKETRIAQGMTREQLAELAGLSVSRIIQIESGYVKDGKAELMIQLMTGPRENENKKKAAGLRIRDARKASGLTVKEAAKLAGLQHTSLAHMESGYVTDKRADELAAIFLNASSKKAFSPTEAGVRIREERKAAGLSQKELATILRITPAAVSAIEFGDVTEERAAEILRRINGERRRPQGTVKRVKRTDQILLGAQIRDARVAAGLSQKEAAELIQVSQGKISLMERGKVDTATARELLQKIEEETKKQQKPPEKNPEKNEK